jgi:hypothetical protein
VGQAPRDLVYVPGWVSHVELAWEEPTLDRFLNRLAAFSRLIVFDEDGRLRAVMGAEFGFVNELQATRASQPGQHPVDRILPGANVADIDHSFVTRKSCWLERTRRSHGQSNPETRMREPTIR